MKNLKHFIVLIVLSFTASVYAQPKFKQKKEQVKSLKVAFITNELKLTSEESAKFWPIYNAFEDKQRELRWQNVDAFLNPKSSDDQISEKDAKTLLAKVEANEEEKHQLRKKFISDLKNILPAVKILKLKKAEDDFNRKLLKQYREKRKK